MPEITFTSSAPIVATVHLTTSTTKEVTVHDVGGGLIAVDLGDVEVGARLVGRPDVLHHLIVEADAALARARGVR